ncbi:MAG: hypothetical protein LBT00_10930 [Spirochaetaceae bacterium]|nr:hypothetical protein [Spirochaetaceae bacterium]
MAMRITGLLRRFAPRNDDGSNVIASEPPVIASVAKQSRVKAFLGWIASSLTASCRSKLWLAATSQ